MNRLSAVYMWIVTASLFSVVGLSSAAIAQTRSQKKKQITPATRRAPAQEEFMTLPQRLPAKDPSRSETTNTAVLPTQAVELPPAVQAASRSELFWQPLKNQFVVSLIPKAGYFALQTTYNNGSRTRFDMSMIANEFGFEYGFNDQFAVRLDTSVARSEYQNGPTRITNEGMTDPRLTLKGQADFGEQSLAYGLIGSVSPRASEPATATSRGNFFSGRDTVKPYLGYQSLVGNNNVWGSFSSYEVQGPERRWDPYNQKTLSATGGNTLSLGAFHEWRFDRTLVGVCLEHLWSERQDLGNGQSTLPLNWLRTEAYGKLFSNEEFELRPSIEYRTLPDRNRYSDRHYDQNDSLLLKLDARLRL